MNGNTLNSTINVTSLASANSNVGTYALTGSGATFSNGTASNYNISYANGTIYVIARPITVGVTGNSIYGNSVATTATGVPNGASAESAGLGLNLQITNAWQCGLTLAKPLKITQTTGVNMGWQAFFNLTGVF